MTDKKNQEMADYVLEHLALGGQGFEQRRKEFRDIGRVNYLALDDKRIMLLSDPITREKYSMLLDILAKNHVRSNTVFYKDGKTFFRNAVYGQNAGLKGIAYKQSKDLSLKNYTPQDVRKMIMLTPAEQANVYSSGKAIYFQPKSDRLEQKIIEAKFTPVIFDYTHIPPEKRFGPPTKKSERICLNDSSKEIGPELCFNERGFHTYIQ